MNRRLITASALLGFCLAGCAANKDFEKEILGHPAPESPSDTGWSRQAPPPPPPPPAARPVPAGPAASAPRPVAAPPAMTPPPPVPAQAGTARLIAPPVVEPAPAVTDPRFAPKPFAPGAAQDQPATPPDASQPVPPPAPAASGPAGPAPVASAPAATAGAPSDRGAFTFLAGSFAHREKAGELMASLESRGFSTRMDQGKLNNKTFFKVFAVKEGNRAELEGELFAAGVTEPRLVEERPLDHDGPPSKRAAAAATKASSPKPSGNIAPPLVEPAPPLPDGYVPPPPKAGGS